MNKEESEITTETKLKPEELWQRITETCSDGSKVIFVFSKALTDAKDFLYFVNGSEIYINPLKNPKSPVMKLSMTIMPIADGSRIQSKFVQSSQMGIRIAAIIFMIIGAWGIISTAGKFVSGVSFSDFSPLDIFLPLLFFAGLINLLSIKFTFKRDRTKLEDWFQKITGQPPC